MSMFRTIFQPSEFTGKHMLGVMVAFFGVIIAVNLVMARFAVSTWSGLVVPNTYVASQEFNEKSAEMRAIAALGYKVDIASDFTGLSITFTDSDGKLALADSMIADLRRPVGVYQDREMVLVRGDDGLYHGSGELLEGEWIATIVAIRDGQTLYKRARRFHVRADGRMRP